MSSPKRHAVTIWPHLTVHYVPPLYDHTACGITLKDKPTVLAKRLSDVSCDRCREQLYKSRPLRREVDR